MLTTVVKALPLAVWIRTYLVAVGGMGGWEEVRGGEDQFPKEEIVDSN